MHRAVSRRLTCPLGRTRISATTVHSSSGTTALIAAYNNGRCVRCRPAEVYDPRITGSCRVRWVSAVATPPAWNTRIEPVRQDDPASNRKHHERDNEVRGTVVGRSRNRWRRLLSRPSQAPTPIPSCCTAPIPTARTCSAITFPTTTKRTPGTVKWTRLCDRESPPSPLGAGSNRDRRRARPAPRSVELPSALGASLPLVHRRRGVTDACTH